MIFETRQGGYYCPGPDHALDGRPLTSLSRGELLSEMQWREEQFRKELDRYRQIGEDRATELREEVTALRRKVAELDWWLMWLASTAHQDN
ncbi:MAG TPA: hypothetical protein VM818_17490 [Vicinamibacterales bacterium]|jgi:hypothetical protein|nr:hypothetical protein [Vicinamibacterales bacterium]